MEGEGQHGNLPLVDLVAAVLLEVALDMADQGDVHKGGGDEREQRQCEHCHCEHHGSERDLLEDQVRTLSHHFIPVKEGTV